MTIINKEGFICRIIQVTSDRRRWIPSKRDWWIVKFMPNKKGSEINLGQVSIPERFVGKKIRFKVEVVE